MKESIIQESIVNFLSMICRQYGFLFFSVPNEGMLMICKMLHIPEKISRALFAILKKMGLLPGASDLIIGHNGKMYCLEVKTKKGKQSDRQKNFEAWCTECGIPYILVRSVDDVQKTLNEWGIVK